MAGNSKFVRSGPALIWLSQFHPNDQPLAEALLREMTLVTRDAFAERLRALILERIATSPGPVGLYAERELPKRKGIPHPLFKQTRTRLKRAYGVGPQPVKPTKSYDPDVGSEGLVAQLVTEVCRESPNHVFNHPGPDRIREKGVKRFILVSDFIGSGKRAETYLAAAWRVKSVQSWWSARATTGMAFEVIAYAATDSGKRRVERHACTPTVSVVTACPTLQDNFPGKIRELRRLCTRYDPIGDNSIEALGFNGSGALIAFAHGAPNNAPRILWKGGKGAKGWKALFPRRSTSGSRKEFSTEDLTAATVRERLVKLRQGQLARAPFIDGAKPQERATLLVLAALSRPPRRDDVIAGKTGLSSLEVRSEIIKATRHGWLDDDRRLTDAGQSELRHAKKPSEKVALPNEPEEPYYPTQLRPPRRSSS